jgi:two-component sensor histidine kinase
MKIKVKLCFEVKADDGNGIASEVTSALDKAKKYVGMALVERAAKIENGAKKVKASHRVLDAIGIAISVVLS